MLYGLFWPLGSRELAGSCLGPGGEEQAGVLGVADGGLGVEAEHRCRVQRVGCPYIVICWRSPASRAWRPLVVR